MPKNSEHTIKELRQVNMLLKKLAEKSDAHDDATMHKLNELEQVVAASKKILKNLPEHDGKLPQHMLEKIHNDLRTPLTPVKAYVQMLYSEKMGELSTMQKLKLKLILQNLEELETAIMKLF